MEGVCGNEKKENTIPISSSQQCSTKKAVAVKRKFVRKPLRDITNLYNSQYPSAIFSQLCLSRSVSASTLVNCRKRKSVDEVDDMHKKTISISLRLHFR